MWSYSATRAQIITPRCAYLDFAARENECRLPLLARSKCLQPSMTCSDCSLLTYRDVACRLASAPFWAGVPPSISLDVNSTLRVELIGVHAVVRRFQPKVRYAFVRRCPNRSKVRLQPTPTTPRKPDLDDLLFSHLIIISRLILCVLYLDYKLCIFFISL